MASRTASRALATAARVLDRAVLSAVNGLVFLTGGAARPHVGSAPKDVVFQKGKLTLHRLRPLGPQSIELGTTDVEIDTAPRVPVPVLLIPPLMVRPWVYDLRPDHSLARSLRNRGFDVFVVDFGVPDETDAHVRLDDYVLDYVPACVDAALAASGASRISMVGYCMGGLFALLHLALWDDARVANIVTIGAPVDFDKMGVLTQATRLGMPLLDVLLDHLGNVPGGLSSAGFRLMGGTRSVTKYADLFIDLYDDEYVRAFDAIDTWLRNMTPYPREAFRQLVKEMVHENKLLKNELSFGGRKADLARLRCPLLAFAGRVDNIATPASTRGVVDMVAATDKDYRTVPGGHIGVIAGSAAPKAVWEPMMDWLAQRATLTPQRA